MSIGWPLAPTGGTVVAMAVGCGGPVEDTAALDDPCSAADGLPEALAASGMGVPYVGTACLVVETDGLGDLRDACAGSLDLRIDGDVLTGTGACVFLGLPGEPGLGALLPGTQSASLVGGRQGARWEGEVTVATSLGDFSWSWRGSWDGLGTELSGVVAGRSTVELGQQEVTASGEGTFVAWPGP